LPLLAPTSFTVETGGTTINGVVTYSVLYIFPKHSTSRYYRIYSKNQTTAKDLGNALQTECMEIHNWCSTFVVSTDPAPLATNVPLNKTITALFSMAMDPATLIDPATTFTVKMI
jgi:hypothetical protein